MTNAILLALVFETVLLVVLVWMISGMVNVLHALEARLSWWDECFQAKKWIFQGERLEVEVRLKKDPPEGAEGV